MELGNKKTMHILTELRKKLFQPLELKRISRTDQFRSLLITIVCIFLFIYVIT